MQPNADPLKTTEPTTEPNLTNPPTSEVNDAAPVVEPTPQVTQADPIAPADASAEADQIASAAPTEVPNSASTSSSETAAASPVFTGSEKGTSVTSSVAPAPSSKKSKRGLLIIGVIVLVLLLGGGYVFGIYLPNQPANVYKNSLSNTAKGIDRLTSYFQNQKQASFASVKFDGKANFKSPSVSGDFTMKGNFDKSGNGDANIAVDVMGENVDLNLRSIKAAGNTSPDIYLQATGIKGLLDKEGFGALDSFDGQWIMVDHTLIDTYASGVTHAQDSSTAAVPTVSQLNDAMSRVNAVNKQYIFTTDTKTAVLVSPKFISKEIQNGRSVDHFKVSYSKDHLQAYISALKSALDNSKLNDWSKQVNGGKSLSEVVDFSSLENSVKNAKMNYTFDLWADTGTKLVHAVKFTDPNDSSSSFTLGQNYTGGSVYPFSLSFVASKDSSGQVPTGTVQMSVDTKSNKYYLAFAANSGSKGSASFTGSVMPSSGVVHESVPAGAKSINDIMGQLLGGVSLDSGLGAMPTDSSQFTLTQ